MTLKTYLKTMVTLIHDNGKEKKAVRKVGIEGQILNLVKKKKSNYKILQLILNKEIIDAFCLGPCKMFAFQSLL